MGGVRWHSCHSPEHLLSSPGDEDGVSSQLRFSLSASSKTWRDFSVPLTTLHCMCSRQVRTALHWIRVEVSRGGFDRLGLFKLIQHFKIFQNKYCGVFLFLVIWWPGDLRMSPHVWCVLILCLCSCSEEMVVDKLRPTRWVEGLPLKHWTMCHAWTGSGACTFW